MSSIYIYWDESHIWGLLLWRAVRAWGLPHKLVRSSDIADGILASENPAALMVPGGWAKRKFNNLGDTGVAAVQEYVRSGGVYIGFCGGCGLGLTGPFGLGLCPWKRRAFTDRLKHMVSGHMAVTKPDDANGLIPDALKEHPLLPVWWPARFEPDYSDDVRVLAAYEHPGPDFWVADLPLTSIAKDPLEDLETQYGMAVWPGYMSGQPCMVEGDYGQGRYLLSYAHLETPASLDANRWLAHIVTELAGIAPPANPLTPAWDLEGLTRNWPGEDGGQDLAHAKAVLEDIIGQGQDQLLLFRRNSWLLGWRRGIAGANINSLYAMAAQAQNLTPTPEAVAYWRAHSATFLETLSMFRHGLSAHLLAERLAMTLGDAAGGIPADVLAEQRLTLFGKHMDYGGLFAELAHVMDKLLWLTLKDGPPAA